MRLKVYIKFNRFVWIHYRNSLSPSLLGYEITQDRRKKYTKENVPVFLLL